MASMAKDLKLQLFVLSVLSFSLSLLVFTTTTFNRSINNNPIIVHLDRNFEGSSSSHHHIIHHVQIKKSPLFDFLSKEFDQGKVKIGLLNIVERQGDDNEEWRSLGETSLVEFKRVQKERSWDDYFPEWIDEEEKWSTSKCPEMPMPVYQDHYHEFDVVVANVPCGRGAIADAGMMMKKKKGNKGIRDVFRLPLNLLVANLVINNGIGIGIGMKRKNNTSGDRPIYVVFIAPCGPMWEIFRCDDLLRHEGDVWIYKPDLRRLEHKVAMPVGTCKLA